LSEDLTQKNEKYYRYSRAEMLKFIPENCVTFLEVGCGGGYFGKMLKINRPLADVHGIEICPEAAEEAKKNLDNVINSDINNALNSLQDNHYDCFIFNDVLEHFADPVDVLKKLKPKLKNGGFIVASIPNVRYFSVIYDLIVNKDWKYQEEGILDYTHLRFFTKKSIPRLFEAAGFKVISINGLNKNRFGVGFKVLNFLCRGSLDDMKYLQYACVAKIED